MPLPVDFLDRLRDANRIDDIMSNYVQIKRAGSISKCLCPFHSEKTASCTIYSDTQSFYCFGCGAGGDVINFIMKIENLDYYEAVKFLAERSGIPLPEDSSRGDDTVRKKQRLYEMNREAARFFFENLRSPNGKIGLKYLIERGLKPETIQKYGLGFAENKWTSLKDHMLMKGYYENELVDASLLGRSKSGRTYDFFKNRVMFPFIDLRGNVIAFGGRTLDPEGTIKYLNSRETIVFKKNKTLFSLNFAKESAIKEKRLLLCEGNMDVISMNQAGFENTVATCGTSITPDHARLMSQYCKEVVICYDSDQAGQKASKKAIDLLAEVGLQTRIIKMEGAKDPDEYIKKFGATRFKLLIDKSDNAVEFELNKAKDGLDIENSDIDRIEYIKKCYDIFSQIENDIDREVFLKSFVRRMNISEETAFREVESRIKKRQSFDKRNRWRQLYHNTASPEKNATPVASAFNKQVKCEEGILYYLYQNPDQADYISSILPSDSFVTDVNKRIYSSLLFKIKNDLDFSVSSFNGEFSPDEMGNVANVIGRSREIPVDKQVLTDYINVLNSHNNINQQSADNMSDDELLKFTEHLRNQKS